MANVFENINNCPTGVEKHKYIVYRVVDDNKWYYGMYDDRIKAVNVAMQVKGYVFTNDKAMRDM